MNKTNNSQIILNSKTLRGKQKMDKKTQTDGKTSIDKLNPMSMTNAEVDATRKMSYQLWRKDKVLFDRANAVVKQLRLFGLWRGNDAAILIVAKAINAAEVEALESALKEVN